MHVTHIRPAFRNAGDIALFDVWISDDLTLRSVRLRRNPDGTWRAHSLQNGSGKGSATFSKRLAAALVELGREAANRAGILKD